MDVRTNKGIKSDVFGEFQTKLPALTNPWFTGSITTTMSLVWLLTASTTVSPWWKRPPAATAPTCRAGSTNTKTSVGSAKIPHLLLQTAGTAEGITLAATVKDPGFAGLISKLRSRKYKKWPTFSFDQALPCLMRCRIALFLIVICNRVFHLIFLGKVGVEIDPARACDENKFLCNL